MGHKARLISIFLLDGEPDGIRTAQIAMSTIIGIAFRDVQLGKVKTVFANQIDRPGVYVLMGTDKDGMKAAYIGQSENVAERLSKWSSKSPEDSPLDWTEVITFVSKDESMTASHARFVEAELIQAAKNSTEWSIPNAQTPASAGKLPKPDEFAMHEFIDQAKTLAGALGCSVFKTVSSKPKQGGLFEAAQTAQAQPESPELLFKMTGPGYEGTAFVVPATGEFVVQVGSIARKQANQSIQQGADKRRAAMLADGVLAEQEDGLRFTKDWPFSSPSMAAGVVGGGSYSGNDQWKLASNSSVTYGAWKASQQ